MSGPEAGRPREPGTPRNANAARDAVLSTPELLVLTLEHLDIKTLLVDAQLVCSQWRDLINSTASLQRQLFFLPAADRRGANGDMAGPGEGSYAELNPLLVKFFGPFYPTELPGFREGRFSSFDEVDEDYYDALAGLKRKWAGGATRPAAAGAAFAQDSSGARAGWKPAALEFPLGLRMGQLWEHVEGSFLHGAKVTVLDRRFIEESTCRQMKLSGYHREFWRRVGGADLFVFGIVMDASDRMDLRRKRGFTGMGVHVSRRVE
ncbi:unnamed protein product [Parascedosporium putredinis]|uniref:F-box domain-containing protein n=1 Tax=Parascedosporium putredinis TaxID=1442378 RepID=A0A9P1MBG3_9PEZI|nr:unnamed protein product [Parascedosporium putredinis]CAI7994769.1 unnamed protein product [Parascedosporium putredinis]